MILSRLKALAPRSLIDLYHFVLAHVSAFYYRYPSEHLTVIGVTGTNGKTTTSYLLAKALEADGAKVGLSSTAVLKIGEKEWINRTKMTMPGRFFLQKMLRDMVKAGCKYAVIETSSQGLVQHRHLGIWYDVAVFTNLAPEHIEAHGGFENYKKAKGFLFSHVATRRAKVVQGESVPSFFVLNADSPHADYYANQGPGVKSLWYGRSVAKGYHAEHATTALDGSDFMINGTSIHLRLPGLYNIENALAAVLTAKELGVSEEKAWQAVSEVAFVPGRFERVDLGQPWEVIVDYAPEPESLKQLYGLLQTAPSGRLIHVLGSCGGGRDVARRPVLGRMAGEAADIVVVTNEDPYDDDPREIMEMIAQGAEEVGKRRENDLFLVEDRAEAIRFAMKQAQAGDRVLMTGKGAERWICEANGKKRPWNEREVAEQAIRMAWPS